MRNQFVADERFHSLAGVLDDRLLKSSEFITHRNVASLWGGRGTELLDSLPCQVGAHAVGVWLLDPENEHLVLAYNTGPDCRDFSEPIRQPVSQGIVSLVLHSEQPFLENEVQMNAQHSKLVDLRLQQQTEAMIVVPLYIMSRCRGVLSGIQIAPSTAAKPPSGFQLSHLASIQLVSSLLGDLIDYRLLRTTIGWT